MSFSLILPYLRPIEHLILDEDVTEIMVNPCGRVFAERVGELTEVIGVALDPKYLETALQIIARLLGNDISEENPILNSRLPDGSRVAAVFPPCSVGGATFTIRKFTGRWFSVDDLVRIGTLALESANILIAAVAARRNILISGGTGSGKTTLLNALAGLIPDNERVIAVEETRELKLSRPNVVRFESRPASPDVQPVSIRDLVKASLRHRPDRLLVGEVRGSEAFDLLQALNTGHGGSLSTIHANSCSLAFSRLTNCVLEAGVDLPYKAIRANIAACINLIVQIERRKGKRLVVELLEVRGYDPVGDTLESERLYSFDDTTSPTEVARKSARRHRQSGA